MGAIERLKDGFAKLGFGVNSQVAADRELANNRRIDSIVSWSMHHADLQAQFPQNPPYEARLRAVLGELSDSSTKFLTDNLVVVAMDQRLNRMARGDWDKQIHTIFYNTSEGYVISLTDDGNMPDNALFTTGTLRHSSRAIAKLADFINENGELLQVPQMMVGISKTTRVGKAQTHFSWVEPEYVDRELDNNTALRTAPLRSSLPEPDPGNP